MNNVQIASPTLATGDVWIFDDVLPVDVFAALRRYVNDLRFVSAHSGSRHKVWRLRDGEPLVGQNYRSAPGPQARMSEFVDHPALAHLLDEVDDRSRAVGLITTPSGFTSASWVYPDGAALAPHVDGPNYYAGSYTFYLHAHWHVCSGGLLIAFDPATQSKRPEEPGLLFTDGNEIEARRLGVPGYGTVIAPRPNRLVFMSSRTEHMITPVMGGPRVSIAGFFYRPEAARLAHEEHLRVRDRAVEIMRRLHQPESDEGGVTDD